MSHSSTKVTGTFLQRLSYLLRNFDYNEAVRLSDDLHAAEAVGHELSAYEDELWSRLSHKIQQENG